MLAGKYQFFYDQMPDDGMRSFYLQALNAARGRQSSFITSGDILKCKGLTIFDAILYMYGDHPELFDLNIGLGSTQLLFSGKVRVNLYYRESGESPAYREKQMGLAVDKVLHTCFPDGWKHLSALKREKLLFNYIAEHVTYDDEAWEQVKTDRRKATQHSDAWSAYGALVKGKAVCQGIACAFKLLCDQVDIPSLVVIGTIAKNLERHAWNIVRIDGQFYHVDCTWMLRTSINRSIPYARYRYFNVPDQLLEKERTAEMNYLPECRSLRHNPFYIRGVCANNTAEASAKIRQMLDQGEKRFAIMCVGFCLSQEDAYEMMRRTLHGTRLQVQWYLGGHFFGGYTL